MNRLWVRLSVTFTLVLSLTVLILSVTTILFIRDGLPTSLILEGLSQPDGLVSQLEAHYAANGSWDDVTPLLREHDLTIPRGLFGTDQQIIFTDADFDILYSGIGATVSEASPVTDNERAAALPVQVSGRTVAHLIVRPNAAPAGFPRPPFAVGTWANGLIGFITVSSILSVIAAIVASRQLTAPLSQLAATARSFSSRNMSARAVVNGTSEVRSVALAFNEMADELESAERLRRSMVADVAHELRTPLTVLQANLQAMLDDVYPMDKQEIGALAEQVDLLRRLVNDLHLLAQAEARQLPLSLEPVQVNALIARSIDTFDAVAQARRITLRHEVPPVPITVSADLDRLTQVLNNLIQNALTHTPEGGTITVTLGQTERMAEISVQDNGVGIPKDAQAHVFDRFYRVDASRDRASGGAGLGLAIVKAIVDLHRGHVTVSSDGVEGHGTRFSVALPLLNA
jgi:two-component system OmpR family sensor kinase/two-component system sensor histidine kinase BaeS